MTGRAERHARGSRDPLHRLAARWGVETGFRDARGLDREADPASLVAVLRAMGAPIEDAEDAADALREEDAREAGAPCEPVTIAWEGRLQPIALRDAARRGATVNGATLELEGGGGVTLGRRDVAASHTDDGAPAVALRLPEPLPFGVHRLHLDLGRGTLASMHLLSAPERCWEGENGRPAAQRGEGRRLLGLFAPVHALRSARSQPTAPGDLTALARLRDWAHSLDVDVVGVLPLLAAFLDEPFDPSPYAPVSRLFWNELYLDLALAPELERSAGARELLAGTRGGSAGSTGTAAPEPARLASGASAANADLVDYQRAMVAQRRVLDALASAAFSSPARRDEIERFAASEPHLDDYARFRATVERQRAGWPAWPQPQRAGRLEPGDYDESSRCRHLYAQWLWEQQFRAFFGEGEELYLDLPIGVHGGGFDVWRFRDQFVPSASVGAPPDLFFAEGQDWGFPPPHPRHARETGHAYFRDIVRAHLRRGAMLRLDHVMALHRLFWIPGGLRAPQGVYVRYPAEELYAILAIESHRHRARIVGENLGTVPPEVDEGLRRYGLAPMRILQFEVSPDWPSGTSKLEGLAALDTHDTATFAGFWEGTEIDLRVRLGLLDEQAAREERATRETIRTAVIRELRAGGWLEDQDDCSAARPPSTGEVLHAFLRAIAASPADVLMVQLEDLWLEPEPQNVPGIASEYPSFKRRMARSLESIEDDEGVASLLRALAALRHGDRR